MKAASSLAIKQVSNQIKGETKMTKEQYSKADLEIVRITASDVLVFSPFGDDGDELPGENP